LDKGAGIVTEGTILCAIQIGMRYHIALINTFNKQERPVANTFLCKIVTPSQEAFNGEATYVSFPAWDGQYGMMEGLAPLLSTLAPGSLRIDVKEGESQYYLVEGGFAHVDGKCLTLVTEGAISAEHIHLEEAKAELAEANARVTSDEKDRLAVEHAQKVASAKVSLATQAVKNGRSV